MTNIAQRTQQPTNTTGSVYYNGQVYQVSPNSVYSRVVGGNVQNGVLGNGLLGASGLENSINKTLQPIANIATYLENGLFWLNVGGIVLGGALTLISIKSLMGNSK